MLIPASITPALLKDEVDLNTDARVLSVEQNPGVLLVSIDDPTGQAAGSLTMIFENAQEPANDLGEGQLRLSQWLVTDAQGLTTSVVVNNLIENRPAKNELFNPRKYER